MKWKMKTTNPRGDPQHFYATSVCDWGVADNLDTLIRKMKGFGWSFQVFRIDLPLDAEYKISNYVPEVPAEKIHFVGFWDLVQ